MIRGKGGGLNWGGWLMGGERGDGMLRGVVIVQRMGEWTGLRGYPMLLLFSRLDPGTCMDNHTFSHFGVFCGSRDVVSVFNEKNMLGARPSRDLRSACQYVG